MIDNDKNHIDNDGGDYVSSFLEWLLLHQSCLCKFLHLDEYNNWVLQNFNRRVQHALY